MGAKCGIAAATGVLLIAAGLSMAGDLKFGQLEDFEYKSDKEFQAAWNAVAKAEEGPLTLRSPGLKGRCV